MESLTAYQIGIFVLPLFLWFVGARMRVPAITMLAGIAMIIVALYYSPPLFLLLVLIGIGLLALYSGIATTVRS